MTKDFPLGIKIAEELIKVIEIAQNEGYGHSKDMNCLLDELKIFVKEES